MSRSHHFVESQETKERRIRDPIALRIYPCRRHDGHALRMLARNRQRVRIPQKCPPLETLVPPAGYRFRWNAVRVR